MNKWKCTGECRLVKRAVDGEQVQVLQQLWVQQIYIGDSQYEDGFKEWEDVPIIDESITGLPD